MRQTAATQSNRRPRGTSFRSQGRSGASSTAAAAACRPGPTDGQAASQTAPATADEAFVVQVGVDLGQLGGQALDLLGSAGRSRAAPVASSRNSAAPACDTTPLPSTPALTLARLPLRFT